MDEVDEGDCPQIKIPTTLVKLSLNISARSRLSFTSNFENLQELVLKSKDGKCFNKFTEVEFRKLRRLEFPEESPNDQLMRNFLENNGENLETFYIKQYNLGPPIAEVCPTLHALFLRDDTNALKKLFTSCQKLESIKVRVGGKFVTEKELLNIVTKYSPKSFCQLKIYNAFR